MRSRIRGRSRRSIFRLDVNDLRNKMTPAERHHDQSAGCVFCHRRFDRVEQSRPESLQAHQFSRGADVSLASALRRGGPRAVLPHAARHIHSRSCTNAKQAFAAVENIPSIRKKAEFCLKWIDSINELEIAQEPTRTGSMFLLNLICFAACIEGLFFFAAFAYVYFLRSKGSAARPRRGDELGLSRRVGSYELCTRGRQTGPERGARAF